MNLIYPMIDKLFIQQKKTKDEKSINESLESWKKYEDMIKNKRCNKMPKQSKDALFEYFNDDKNEASLLEIFGRDAYESFKNEGKKLKENKKKTISEEDIKKLKIVLKYYENYEPESKQQEIIILRDAIEKGEAFEYNKYLQNVDEKTTMNIKYPLVKIVYESNFKGIEKIEESKIKKALNSYNKIENMIKNKKTARLAKDLKKSLLEFFKDMNNRQLLLEIFTQEQIDNYINQNNYKISEENINKLNEVIQYYTNYFFESKKKEIEEIRDIIKNQKNNYEPYLKEYEIAKTMNLRLPLVNVLFNYSNKEKTETNLNESAEIWKHFESKIKEKNKLAKMKKDLKKLLFDYFNDKNNEKILLQIFKEDELEYFKNANSRFKESNTKISKEDIDKLNIILTYYQNYFSQQKKDDIISIQKAIKGEKKNYEEYLKYLEIAQKKNDEFPVIDYLCKKSENNKKENKDSLIAKQAERFENFKKFVKNRKKLSRIKGSQEILSFFINESNKDIAVKIFTQEDLNWIMNEAKQKFSKKKLKKEVIDNLNLVKEYYKCFCFETKTEEIKFLEKAISLEEEFDYNKYLENLADIKMKLDKYPIIEYLLNINNKGNNKNITEGEINNLLTQIEKIEILIKSRKLEEITLDLEEIQLSLFAYFKDLDNREELLKIFNEEEIKYFLDNEMISEENISKLKEIKSYYKDFMYKEKEEDIDDINEIISLRKGKYRKYLQDYDKAKYWNSRYPLINSFIEENNEDDNIDYFEEAKEQWNVIEKVIKNRTSFKRLKNRKKIFKKLKEKDNREKLDLIFEEDILNDFFLKVEEYEKKEERKKQNSQLMRKIKDVLNYLENNCPDKQQDINLYKEALESGKIFDEDKFSEYYEKSLIEKNKLKVLDFLNGDEKNEKVIKDNKRSLDSFIEILRDKKVKKMKIGRFKKIAEYMKLEEEKDVSEQYFTKEERSYILNYFKM